MNTMTNNDQWPDLLQAYYGVRLLDPQSILWQKEMKRSISTGNSEMCESIRAASDNNMEPRDKFRGATAVDLIKWVKMYRAKNFKPSAALNRFETQFIADWKVKMTSGGYSDDDFKDALFRLPSKCSIMKQIDMEVRGE